MLELVELNEIFVDLLSLEYQEKKETEISEWDGLFLDMATMGNLEYEEFK